MADKEILLESTESYLKSLIAEVARLPVGDSDVLTPFQELGIDSFRVLQIIRKLEEEFGTLPKTLLFENFNISDLSHYFVSKHEQVLSGILTNRGQTAGTVVNVSEGPLKPTEDISETAAVRTEKTSRKTPVLILEKEVEKHPELQELVKNIFDRHKNEGSSSRGTRNIAPNLFIGSEKRGYFNYSRSKNIILVYTYTGPRDYFPMIAEEIYQYCAKNNFELNLFSSEQVESVGDIPFSATPFGVLSRITIKDFSLQGSKMRRLRYQVSKFEGSGQCRTEEYHNGSDKETDRQIAGIIDRWCAPRTMVNPLIYKVKDEVLAGNLSPEHRLFLTYLDDILQNVILVSKLSSEANGYLMDLEFYPEDMPLGGLEFAIVKIIETLAAEKCDILSLGGTYGCKLAPSPNADPELDKTLDYLREQNIFNDEGNLQFKNKFRPGHSTVFLCRAVGSNPDNVTDIIMMIADPVKMQTSDEENHTFSGLPKQGITPKEKMDTPEIRVMPGETSPAKEPRKEERQAMVIEGEERSVLLSDFGYNPLNIPDNKVDFDLKTDSWAQLELPAIRNQLSYLYTQLQQAVSPDESLRDIFPFSRFALTTSGRMAEHAFCKSWPEKGVVLQNLLFPTTIFHQIENSFTPRELPHPEVFKPGSNTLFRGGLDWETFQKQVGQDPRSIAFVLIELNNNAAGGAPVSAQHLRKIKTLLSEYNIPLVLDATRIVENARFIIENEKGFSGKNTWEVVREICTHADAVIASLAKDFCVNKGGLIATDNAGLFDKLQALIEEEGIGLDVIDKKIIALSLRDKNKLATRVQQRMESVRTIRNALKQHGIPVVGAAGGHCVLIDVKQIPEFMPFEYPVASFVSWLFLNTGIRSGAHNAGMQKNTAINDLVRLAIPVGLKPKQVEEIINRLVFAFNNKVNIPEILPEGDRSDAFGNIHTNFKLKTYHKLSGNLVPGSAHAVPSSGEHTGKEKPLVSGYNPEETEEKEATKAPGQSGDIAIVGIAGRYPKAANMSEFWDNLLQGRDCIEDIPDVRFNRRLRNNFSTKYRGGFIDDVDKFDSLFFNISPREAEYLDPQERLFLEVAWETIEDAGYYPETLTEEGAPRDIGVFVGAVWTLYQMLGVEEKFKGNNLNPSSHLWGISNRVSYTFNLSGPSLTVDTACSSSLTALYLACEAIHKGECSGAIVGGVNLDVHQSKIDINKGGGALSEDGVCRTFGKGANGYVAGEGIGAAFLKPLDKAIKDGDHIYGVIKGIAINHGGKTGGFMVPSPKAQSKVVATALENAKIDARSIGYIEAHGTGTELGDPIEISGLTMAFEKYNIEKQACSVGSVKTNIGHLEAAAGIAGLHKVLLQMKHGKLVSSLHSSEPNPFIDFENSPFYVAQSVKAWEPKVVDGTGHPLRAGISSFGAGGANAHVIVEAYKKTASQQKGSVPEPKARIFPLSARNEDQLKETAVRLLTFLRKDLASGIQVNAGDMAYTLRIGRKSFDYRLAVIAGTKEELAEKLALFIEGKKDEAILSGQIKSSEGITRLLNRKEKEEFIKLLSRSGDLHKLSRLWIDGLLTDWQGIQALETGTRVPLPTYPFADKRHWISRTSNPGLALRPEAGIHPLIDSNESTFERQVFKKTFHHGDFFIYDHLVSGIPTLPGVAYLDFARKAGELAAGRKVQKIRNILWLSPLAVNGSGATEAFIELKPSGSMVQFEVFSEKDNGEKQLHSQGKIAYATTQETEVEPEFIDLESIRARVVKAMDGKDAYPHFKSLGLDLGPSFQVLREVFQNRDEILGVLEIPEECRDSFEDFVLHPSLIDGTGQTGMAAQFSENNKGGSGEMFVPYSFGEVEILYPLPQRCYAYVIKTSDPGAKLTKTNILIVDESGKILVKIKDSVGVPLVSVHEKPESGTTANDISRLYYAPVWEKSPLVAQDTQNSNDPILFFDTDDGLGSLYQAGLKAAGEQPHHIILVKPGGAFQDLKEQTYTINPQNPEDFTRLFESLDNSGLPCERICYAWPLGQGSGEEYNGDTLRGGLDTGVYAFLYLCQALIGQKYKNGIELLYLYTCGKDNPQPHHEAVNGFVKTLHIEHSKLSCKTLEIQQEKTGPDGILDDILAEFGQDDPKEMTVRYDGKERYVRKLKAYGFEENGSSLAVQGPGFKEKGVYIIAGGAGGLGLIFAGYLAGEYKARLVLTGRSDLSAEREARLEKLRETGAEVLYFRTDISRAEDVERLIRETKSVFGAVNGIIHSAGVLRDSYIRNKTREELDAVLAPKLYGTLNLDVATRDEDLDFFVMFSSMAAVGGNMGQSDYAFANYFMDAFAARRELLRAKGERSGKSLSINWSIWADGGMKLDEQTEIFFKKTLGISPLRIETGLETLARGLHIAAPQLAVVEGDREKIELAWGLRKEEPAVPVSSAGSLQQETAGPAVPTADGELMAMVRDELSQIVMDFLKLDAEDIAIDKILMDLGFDSIGLATFANSVNDKYGLDDVTPVLFFEYPSIEEIAKFLCSEHKDEMARYHQASQTLAADSAGKATAQQEKAGEQQQFSIGFKKGWDPAAFSDNAKPSPDGNFSAETRFRDMPIAIVGMSGVMPQSDDLDEFWENLKNAENNMVTLIPKDRWNWEDYYGDPLDGGNKTRAKWGGFMREVDKFDPLFWGISPLEAAAMDPQQRIFLETVWHAIEDSGHKVSELAGTKTGVFVGAATRDYIDIMNQTGAELSGYSGSGTSHAVLANRVSYLLNLHGPSAPLDTACSSSLVALHRAIESIHTGSSEMAIVGGVQVMLTPAAFISFGAAGMLADDGKCKTFDERANGYVRGEGSGAIFIKPLSRAEADGDHIYAVIKSTAENHGGKVTVLTAPNPSAQADLLVEAYEKAGIDPATVGYMECHGTGTKLGDPIEVQAMKKAFAELYKKHGKGAPVKPHIGLTSVKSNIGHLETGAGIAGILKVLLSIRHKKIPALLHFEKQNSFINIENTPFYMVDKLRDWEAARGEDGALLPRRAGVSSFGFGGANVHVVLEEYIPPRKQRPFELNGPYLIVLSAKNQDRLTAYVQKMLTYLENHEIELADFAYTLQVGRDAMAERLAIVVSNGEELRQRLSDFLENKETADLYHYNIRTKTGRTQPRVDKNEDLPVLIKEKRLDELAGLWVSGKDIDWSLLYKQGFPKRLSLPAYPFARERYWFKTTEDKNNTPAISGPVKHLHPLIHRNVSTFEAQKFASLFTGEEFFFADHMVGTQKILPGVAYMEMARVAGELSASAKVRFIRDLVWVKPLIVEDKAKEVEIALMPNRNEFDFSVRTIGEGTQITHCYGKLAYTGTISEPDVLDIEAIRSRCPEEIFTGNSLYDFLSGTGLNLGKGFQIVQKMYANESESLAVVELPEHLKETADRFWLHPALMDGSIHSGAGLLQKSPVDVPFSLPFSVGEVQVIDTLKDLRYGYATWAEDNDLNNPTNLKTNFCLLDKNGKVLVRIKDFISKPLFKDTAETDRKHDERQLKSGPDNPVRGHKNETTGITLQTGGVSGQMIRDFVQQTITETLAEGLNIDAGAIDPNTSYADYGVDSIVGVNLIRTINKAFGIELETISLFEHGSVDKLTQYIVSDWSEKIAGQLQQSDDIPLVLETVEKQENDYIPEEVSGQMIRDFVQQTITETLAEGLNIDAGTIDHSISYADYGVDSIVGVNLIRTINKAFGIELETISLFEHGSVDKLTQYIVSDWSEKIAEQLRPATGTLQGGGATYPDNGVHTPVASSHRFANVPVGSDIFSGGGQAFRAERDQIAIVGMSGRISESESLDEFWEYLKNGKDMVREVSRWNPAECVMPGTKKEGYCTRGGFLKSAELFDPGFFKISPLEAQYMDPQQRLFMEESFRALEDAGYAGKGIDGKQCGVYVGCGETGYSGLFKDNPPAQAFWGNAISVIPARIAYYLNLRGPAVAIDTACSSSLVAIHTACQGLWSKETDMALAGGVFVMPAPGYYQNSNRAGMLSPEGKCYAFDSRANGFVPGEGVGVVVLKRLQDALQDGDNIHGVIIGSGINQDGSTNGITAPSAMSQERLELSVYDRFGINPESIQLVEAHGTGTPLGDPIEYRALSNAFRKYSGKDQFCAIGSVKTNIGHAATAAGVAGVLKLLLSFKHKQLPPSIHFREGNPAIKFGSSPFYVNTALKEWKTGNEQKRRSAISSFGFSGTNAHMVFEEAPALKQAVIELPAYLVVLSARTSGQLGQQAKNLLSFCNSTPDVSLNNLAYTLFVGRMHLSHRLACVVRDRRELVECLEKWMETGAAPRAYTSEINEGKVQEQASLKNFANQCIHECRNGTGPARYVEHLSTVAELFIKGYSLDFEILFPKDSKRISLPAYPFARERHWVEPTFSGQQKQGTLSPAFIHPLLHTNTSDLSRQSYSSLFDGEEFFLSDHRVNGNKVLPGVAYLEMVRAAVMNATPGQVGTNSLKLSDIVWLHPIAVAKSKEISIELVPDDDGQIAFEIYSGDGEQETIHCRGRAIYGDETLPDRIDIDLLYGQMQKGGIDIDAVYKDFVRVGIDHGPSYKGVTSLYRGEEQLLARLTLPAAVESTQNDYVLHPALLDSALQASMGLIMDENSREPKIPFAVEYVRIISPCTKGMYACIRYAPGSRPGDSVTKLDIDLCDFQGNICVQMYGFSARVLKMEPAAIPVQTTEQIPESADEGKLYALAPVWTPLQEEKHNRISIPASTRILLLGGDPEQLNWVKKSYENAELLKIPSGSDIHSIKTSLDNRTFDHLLWIAPDVPGLTGHTEEGGDRVIESQEQGVLTVFRIIKALLKQGYANKLLQWTQITGNTQSVEKGDHIRPVHAGVFGMAGSLAKEFPGWKLRLLDVDSLESLTAAECMSLNGDKQGDGLAYRRDRWFVPGLARMADLQPSAPIYKQKGVYVVIGGAGGLGEVWSRFMIENYQAKIVWIGRRKADNTINDKIRRLAQIGEGPVYIPADATKPADLERARKKILEIYPAINGVVQSAVVLKDQGLVNMDESVFRASLSAKVDISVNMDSVFGDQDLDFMLFFSSIVSLFKTPGQANYAAGCAFKDSLAHRLEQQRDYPVKVMNWGYWGSVGVATDDFYKKRIARMGIGSIEPGEGMLSLQTFVNSGIHQIVLIKILSDQLLEAIALPEEGVHSSETASVTLPQEQETVPVRDSGNIPALEKNTPEKPAGSSKDPGRPLREKSIAYFQNMIAEMLRMKPRQIDPQKPLPEFGLDSIMIGQLTEQLRKVFPDISATLFFEVQSVNELVEYFLENKKEELVAVTGHTTVAVLPQADAVPERKADFEPARAQNQKLNFRQMNRPRRQYTLQQASPSATGLSVFDVAIVGLSGRYPESGNLVELWKNLSNGVNCIREVPGDRWNREEYYDPEKGKPGKMYTKWGGFIKDIDKFDPAFFKISPREAEAIDPQERLFVQACYHAIEDAGYIPGDLDKDHKVGVFAGVLNSRYTVQPNFFSFANRVSYLFNFQGPSMAVDTACSSSLTAIHLALESLYGGLSSVAIAGGVNLIVDPPHYLRFSEMNMLSGDNKNRSFGAQGDGFVDAEGVGAVVLKPLARAEEDGDHIYGIIKGSALNAGGKTNGYNTPNPRAQANVVSAALERCNMDAGQISYIEAHGTGTTFGDSIEIAGLTRAFGKTNNGQQFCAIGSVKSNIGHTESAAGIAGLTKVLLQMKYRQLVPSINADVVNPEIDFGKTPFKLQKKLEKWERRKQNINGVTREIPRTAGISAFGAGGANAHLIVQEYIPSHSDGTVSPGEVIIPLSARSAVQLRQKAHDLLDFIRETGTGKINLASMAYTLQSGREAMEERLGFVVDSAEQLSQELQAYIDDASNVEDAHQGNINEGNDGLSFISQDDDLKETIIRKWVADNKLSKLLGLWIKGLDFDWNDLYREAKPERMSLPVYPFARERYWSGEDVSVQVRNVPFPETDNGITQPAIQSEWVFAANGTTGKHTGSMKPVRKIELFLQQEIARQLQVPPGKIGVEDSFFELGLDSIGITKIIDETNRLVGGNLLSSVVFEYINIQKLSEFIVNSFPEKIGNIVVTRQKQNGKNGVLTPSDRTKQETSVWKSIVNGGSESTPGNILVPMQTAGNKLPIFAIPGAGGNVLCFQPLSHALGKEQPFYGLQAVGLDGQAQPIDSVRKIAEANIAALKSVQPSGPYRLLGYSNGGVIAFEMAKMLYRQKEKIASLVLLDSLCPTLQTEDEVEQIVDLYKNLAHATGVNIEDIDTGKLRQTTGDDRVEYLYDHTRNCGFEMTREQFTLMYNVAMTNARACRTYKPTRFQRKVNVTLFRASEGYPDKPDDYGWAQWLKNPPGCHEIKADHFSMVDKGPAGEIAGKIQEIYDEMAISEFPGYQPK